MAEILRGPATGAQLRFLQRLAAEAFAAGYSGEALNWAGLDSRQALRSIETARHSGKRMASEAISAMLAAKARGWSDG
jgi:hypothetical protein